MFKLTVVTPEKRLVVDQEIDEVTVPGFRGELNILPGHAPLITTLETGILRWKLKGASTMNTAVISWGYCQVSPAGVDILADMANLPEEIDVTHGTQNLQAAERKLANETLDEAAWKTVHRDIARIQAEMELVKRH